MYVIRRLAGHVYVLLSYLPTVPEFPGQSWKLTSQLAVPEVFKIVPGILTWQVHILLWLWQSASGAGSVPATGWMPVG